MGKRKKIISERGEMYLICHSTHLGSGREATRSMSGKSPPSLTRGWAGPELQVMLDPECVRYQASVNGRRWLKQGREKGVVNSSAGKGGACAEGRLKPHAEDGHQVAGS